MAKRCYGGMTHQEVKYWRNKEREHDMNNDLEQELDTFSSSGQTIPMECLDCWNFLDVDYCPVFPPSPHCNYHQFIDELLDGRGYQVGPTQHELLQAIFGRSTPLPITNRKEESDD